MTFAQSRTDLALADLFPGTFRGSYLDIGANHPITDSNTYLFYRLGWRGVCVEPIGSFCELHRQIRPGDRQVHAAISDRDGRVILHECSMSTFSTLDPHEAALRAEAGHEIRPVVVPAYSLKTIARRWMPSAPDILSIDVEGHERPVLIGAPLEDGWLPRSIVIEACRPCTVVPCHEEWEGMLTEVGYAYRATCGVNRIYVRGDRP